ncbi:MAG: alpha/beta hydrolase [Acidobacteria bacterium]|nr:alpha/beta hydrolase [Acidobacteriota bacterium]
MSRPKDHHPHREHGVAVAAEALRRERAGKPRGLRRRIVLLLLLVSMLLIAYPVWRFTRAHLQSIVVLKLLSGEKPSPLLSALATEPITETELTLQTSAGPVRARLYTPVRHPQAAGMVVFHGVHHLGMNEPRLMAFARATASCGIRVLTPELPEIADYRVGERSIDTIGASTVWFAQQTHAPVGVLGLSFSGGLALVAAANDRYRPSMKFVFAVGSQDSMGRVAAYYRTNEETRPDGTRELLPAHEYGPLVLEYEHVDEFVPAQDVDAIRAVLRAHLYEEPESEKAAMDKLTAAQKLEAAELMNARSEKTRALLQTSEEKYADAMKRVSPEQSLKKLTVPVYLLHGEADNIIPAAETLWMASELRKTSLRAALVSPVLSHLDMQQSPGAWEQWRLIHFMALVLNDAEKK